MEEKLAALETRLKTSEQKIEELKIREKTIVAFSASAEYGGAHGPFDADTTLVYNTPIANFGDAYNKFTGVFVAPVAGVYHFVIFFQAGGQYAANLTLFKNGEPVIMTTDEAASYDSADTGGNAAVLELKKGDQLYVRMAKGSHVLAATQHTTFSGFLIRQM
ncbi:complement C1q tumor necrosis factor-related protein 1-like [Lates japonicus]|uniref:Complement C1q tumor necrosis factor-related protein 1-like protein n=1 Tax=Lates japonicus TaxID=270547 RepID=A0AAD3N4J7_LATJO|nr:complement C1q tumor necrosis factor-related protein 1-like protein [Lates japonicus]